MKRIYYAERDTTLYEKHPDQNTGIDEILELTKIASGSRLHGEIQAKTYNSRILIDFGTEINSLSASISAGDIPVPNNTHELSSSIFLNLHASDGSDLLHTYDIKAYPVSQSWDNGNGRVDDEPKTRIGASWLYAKGDAIAQTGEPWNTGSAHSKNTSAGTTEDQGGATWVTGSFSGSQTFQNESPDLRIDVTNIVKNWIAGNVNNNGFIVKRPYADEIDGEVRGSIKFFGRESHTIFVPRLEVCWDDYSIIASGSDTIQSNTYVPYIKNIKSEYRTSDIARFRVGVRPEFPTKTYVTSSFYLTGDVLPESSSYEILDSVTNEVIIKDEKLFSDSRTKISNDSDGCFFDLRMDSFFPERVYKIKLTCRRTNDTQTFDDFNFKVVN